MFELLAGHEEATLKSGVRTMRTLLFYCLSDCMGYDCGDSFPFDFEPVGFQFGSKSEGKLSRRSYPIQRERKWNASFLTVEGGTGFWGKDCIHAVFVHYKIEMIICWKNSDGLPLVNYCES